VRTGLREDVSVTYHHVSTAEDDVDTAINRTVGETLDGRVTRRHKLTDSSTVRHTSTHTHMHGQTQNDFIICPMLYAIAMGQMKIRIAACTLF